MRMKRILTLLLALLLALCLGTGALASETPGGASGTASAQSTQPETGDQAASSAETGEAADASQSDASASSQAASSDGQQQADSSQQQAGQGEALTVTYDPTSGSTADPVPGATATATLLMDAATGTVLWEKNAHEVLEPASVTKIMTMLLVCEAIDAGRLSTDQMVTTSAHAAGMGGSQVYLEEGEQMSVQDLLKAVAVASGNDAAVALGEAVAGSESAFVEQMNQRAAQLGMEDTHFVNCTGLPTDGHVTSAYDIALMSRELLKHDLIRQFTGIWMDSLRNGAFGLSSTNKLVHSYDGCTGLKTGFTATAGYCISATAQRGDMELIAVVLGAESSKDRFNTASTLLDWGFANFKLVTVTPEEALPTVPVSLGTQDSVALEPVQAQILIRSADEGQITTQVVLPGGVEAPVEQGGQLGSFVVQIGDQVAAVCPLEASQSVERLQLGDVFLRFVKNLLSCPQ